MILCMCIRFYTGLVANIYSFLAKITFIVFFSPGYTHKKGYQRTLSVGEGQGGSIEEKTGRETKTSTPPGWSGQTSTSKGDFWVEKTGNEAGRMVSGPP